MGKLMDWKWSAIFTKHAVNKESKNYPTFRHVFQMQTNDLNVNDSESDNANAIFRQFQDAIFSR